MVNKFWFLALRLASLPLVAGRWAKKRLQKGVSLSFLTLALAGAGECATPPDLLGTWQVDETIWQAQIVIGPDRISLGSEECRDLPYTLIKHVSLGQKGEVYALDIDAPFDRCRSYKQEKVIWYLRIQNSEGETYMNIHICPSMEDLELFMQGKNRYCSGSFLAQKEHELQPPRAR